MKILFAMTALFASSALAAPEVNDVFVGGENGFPAVRIPSIVCTKSGALLAFAEGRKNLSDQAENKIILRRSTDGGKTWGALQTIADDGKRPLNNPCAVVDQKNGRVLLMFQSYPEKLKEGSGQIKTGHDGDDIVKSYLVRSDDEGATWSKIEDVTRQVKRPEKVTTIASGPGIGIQLQKGAHAGRLIIPFNEGPFGKWNIYAAYSDDGGANWKIGDNVPAPAGVPNECQIAERADGTLLFNARQMGGKALRKISTSRDGGQTWSPIEDAPDLVDPRCMGSIIAIGNGRMLYSGPRSTKRENGTIYLSEDDGKTWPLRKTLAPGFFAYSNLVALPDGTFGCLYEADGYKRIVFARFTLDWLKTPDARTAQSDRIELHMRLAGAEPMIWVMTGDSITQGAVHTKGTRAFPEHVAERLRWEMNRRRDAVINTGISGEIAEGLLKDFEWRVAQYRPAVVCINIGMNDSAKGRDYLPTYEASLRELVVRVRAINAIPVIATTNVVKNSNARVAVLTSCNETVRKLAQENGVILVDNWKHWQAQKDGNLWLSDDIHPNGSGHAAMAAELLRALDIFDAKSPLGQLLADSTV